MRILIITVALALLLVLLIPLVLGVWLDARWFSAQQLEALFFLRLRTQLGLGCVSGILAAIFIWLNIGWATHRVRATAEKEGSETRSQARLSAVVPSVAVVGGSAFGLAAAAQWQTLLGFLAQVPFGTSDPSFGQDVAFYVWTVPMLLAARDWLMMLLLLTVAATALVYFVGLVAIQPNEDFQVPARSFNDHPLAPTVVRHVLLSRRPGWCFSVPPAGPTTGCWSIRSAAWSTEPLRPTSTPFTPPTS
jgi:uncharacterized membrane protein (UPF0182 family)